MNNTPTRFVLALPVLLCAPGVAQEPAERAEPPTVELASPVRLEASGAPIDTGENIAHSGPMVMDFDGDGVRDLLVGNFRGTIHVFRNTGSNREPVYEDKGYVEADSEIVKIKNW